MSKVFYSEFGRQGGKTLRLGGLVENNFVSEGEPIVPSGAYKPHSFPSENVMDNIKLFLQNEKEEITQKVQKRTKICLCSTGNLFPTRSKICEVSSSQKYHIYQWICD